MAVGGWPAGAPVAHHIACHGKRLRVTFLSFPFGLAIYDRVLVWYPPYGRSVTISIAALIVTLTNRDTVLVYLDTAFFSTYVKAQRAHRSQFLTTWRKAGATLALSFAHIIELRQHGSAPERSARYDALTDFLPIRTTLSLEHPQEIVVDVEGREILAAGLRRGLELDHFVPGVLRNADDVTVDAFPYAITGRAVLDKVREAEAPWFDAGVKDMRGATTIGSIAQRRAQGTSASVRRLSDIPDNPLSLAEAAAKRVQAVQQFGPVLAAGGESASITRSIVAAYLNSINRAMVVGQRRATIERLEAELGFALDAEAARQPVRQLEMEAKFRLRVRTTLTAHCARIAATERAKVAASIKAEDCPGFSLQLAVDRQIYQAEPEPKPGNYWDIEHAMYLPYVDRFFTDRRIETFVAQAIANRHGAAGLTGKALRRNADSLSAMAERIAD